MATKLINLCPHDITIVDEEGHIIMVLPHEEGRVVSIPQAVISWLQQYHAGSRVALEMM